MICEPAAQPATAVADNFEAVAAEVLADPAIMAAPAAEQSAATVGASSVTPTAGATAPADSVSGLLAGLSPESVQKWLEMPFNVAASVLKDNDYKLQSHEVEIMVEPLRVLANKYLPEALKKTDNPELIMVGVGVMAYAARIGLKRWSEPKDSKKPAKGSEPTAEPAESKPESKPQPEAAAPAVPALSTKAPSGMGMNFQTPALAASLPV